ncbi:IclR family transcriptional regulator [Glaciibacter superstes]|uniref:IclR family transcriptional regulator n=1 Tax=Glaciibacter superstes TaxID=501023 RepID=UPI0003B43D2D|nr:IclR family transcriptional regulator [Glaciibacter superstes]
MTVAAETPSDQGYPISSVDNALRLLELFAQGTPSIRVAEASRILGVARSTAHRLLQVLAVREFVRQDPDSRVYLIGPALIRLSIAVSRGLDLATVARPIMSDLVETTGETVHLVVLHGADAFFLESIETSKGLRVGGRAGQLLPAYATASGRVLLAEFSADELHHLLQSPTLPRLTPHTVGQRSKLESILADTRQRGYATSYGESEEDVSSVAVPVRRHDDSVIAALAVGAPPSRLSDDDAPAIAKALQAAARQISDRLP